VGEVTAAATFYMAEVYGEFSRALLESERPADLTAAELGDYEMVLEEEAYPFEEKSIDVHEKNLELMAAGVFNTWIEKSMAELAVVMPGRYAKFDASTGLLSSIKSFTYQTPRSLIVVAEAEPLPATSPSAEASPSETASPLVETEVSDPELAQDVASETVPAEAPGHADESAPTPAADASATEAMPASPAPAEGSP
jgi:hypothetical protein